MSRTLELMFPPDPGRMGRLRAAARRAAAELGMESLADPLCLVIDELVSNALEHGQIYRRRGDPLCLRLTVARGRLRLDFIDPEMPEAQVREVAGALRSNGGLPALDSERGRGLFLIAIHMEELRVGLAPGGGLHLQGLLQGQ